jgi:hypothetical protein
MSEDRFEQEEAKDEDVDAHRKQRLASDDEGSETSDDAEAHRMHRKANEEPGSDESDDVEAHHHRTARHKEL